MIILSSEGKKMEEVSIDENAIYRIRRNCVGW